MDPDAFIQMEGIIERLAEGWRRAFSAIDLEGSFTSTEKASKALAEYGWTLPMQLTPGEVVGLAGQPIEEIDAFFVDLYTDEDCAALRRAGRELLTRKGLLAWRGLLEECLEVFEEGRYLVTIPALISTIEGVVATAGNSLHNRNVSKSFLTGVCANKANACPRSIHGIMWRSLEIFVEKLFQNAPFDRNRPPIINRHWILHGRDLANWTKADSLRLFCALETIDSLLE